MVYIGISISLTFLESNRAISPKIYYWLYIGMYSLLTLAYIVVFIRLIKSMKRFRNSYKVSMFTWDKATEEKKVQDLLDELLQKSYPFISQGRGFTDPLNTVTHLSFKILPDFIPEGEEGSALVSLGQHLLLHVARHVHNPVQATHLAVQLK